MNLNLISGLIGLVAEGLALEPSPQAGLPRVSVSFDDHLHVVVDTAPLPKFSLQGGFHLKLGRHTCYKSLGS